MAMGQRRAMHDRNFDIPVRGQSHHCHYLEGGGKADGKWILAANAKRFYRASSKTK